jgi:DNA-binding transcriptional ArsR family regulator
MYQDLNPLLHSRLRLAIMSILISSHEADFVFLRKATNSSAGNLSIQIEKLREAGYLTAEKSFQGKMPRTTCRITSAGISAFEQYVEVLRQYLPGERG